MPDITKIPKSSIITISVVPPILEYADTDDRWIPPRVRPVRGPEGISKLEAMYINPTCTISILAVDNPKHKSARPRFDLYADGDTVEIFCIKAPPRNKALLDLAWDFNRGFIDIFPPKTQAGTVVLAHDVPSPSTATIIALVESTYNGNNGSFDPNNISDARERIATLICQRRGQKRFWDSLIDAYNSRCAISGCNVIDVLEAAHIYPYRGDETNRVDNVLLLRSDLHILFDLGYITIDPKTFAIEIADALQSSEFGHLPGLFNALY